MTTAVIFILVLFCTIRTLSYGIYVIKENKTGGISVFLLTLLSLGVLSVCFID